MAIRVAYEYLASGQAEAQRSHLRHLTEHAHARLRRLCSQHAQTAPALLRVAADVPASPILPVLSSRPRSLARHCQERGFTVRPIVAPTVPQGSERVRICLHAANTTAQVDGLCVAVGEWAERQQRWEEAKPRL